jgi:cysteine desulfurase
VPRHYLDHASTTPLRPEARSAVAAELDAGVGDPGRVHEEGRSVRERVEAGRDRVAALFGVRPRQVIFTSSGTEAINAAVFGATRTSDGRPVACAAVEHSAVREASSRVGPVEQLAVDGLGRIEVGVVEDVLLAPPASRPMLVNCQWANHEVGTVQPVGTIVELCRHAGVSVHVDACAAAGHLAMDLEALGADLVSVSAHKFGGPAGVGALIVRRGSRFAPLLVGGQQERARRAGFENAPAIAGFAAVAESMATPEAVEAEASAARQFIERILAAALAVDGVTLVGDPDPDGRLPHLVCIGVSGVEAEPIVIGLDRAGIAIHSGSACSSELLEPSPVLAAMGVDPAHSLRPSVGWSTSDDDVSAFADAFTEVVTALRQLRS